MIDSKDLWKIWKRAETHSMTRNGTVSRKVTVWFYCRKSDLTSKYVTTEISGNHRIDNPLQFEEGMDWCSPHLYPKDFILMDKNKRIRRIAKRITKNDILNPYPIQFTFHAEYLYQDYWIYDLDGDIEYKILIMDTDSKKLKDRYNKV